MKRVDDPNVLAQLNGGGRKRVDDPEVLAQLESQPSMEWYQPVRSALQGMTFGFSDELGSLSGAAMAKMSGEDAPYMDIYRDMQSSLKDERDQFRDDFPKTALATELIGGITTGGAGAHRVLGSQIAKQSPKLAAAALGAAEGGIYGAGAAAPGERTSGATTGAAIGAVAAPLGGYALEKSGNALGHVSRFIAKKLNETPKNQAVRLIRDAAERAGLNSDEVVARYEALGPEGLLADVDDNYRGLARALTDQLGEAKRTGREVIEGRQMGTVGRVVDATKKAISGDDADSTIKTMAADMKAKARPFYASADQSPFAFDDYTKTVIESVPEVKRAYQKAIRQMSGKRATGEQVGHMRLIDAMKKNLDDKIGEHIRAGRNNAASDLIKVKNEILSRVDAQVPDYKTARNIYSGQKRLMDMVDKGRDFFGMSSREFDDIVTGATDSELQMLRTGAARAILDKMENTQFTHDAAKKLVNTQGMQSKLLRLFKSEDDALAFIRQMQREAEFIRTRQVVNGGSPTSQNLAVGDGLNEILDNAHSLAGTGDPTATALSLVGRLFGKKPPSPEVIAEATELLFNKGLTPQVLRSAVAPTQSSRVVDPLVGQWPYITRGAAAPAGMLGYQELVGQ